MRYLGSVRKRPGTKPVHRSGTVADGKDEPTAHHRHPVTSLLRHQPELLGRVRVEIMLRQGGQQQGGMVRMEAEAKAAGGVLSDTPLLEVLARWCSDFMPQPVRENFCDGLRCRGQPGDLRILRFAYGQDEAQHQRGFGQGVGKAQPFEPLHERQHPSAGLYSRDNETDPSPARRQKEGVVSS